MRRGRAVAVLVAVLAALVVFALRPVRAFKRRAIIGGTMPAIGKYPYITLMSAPGGQKLCTGFLVDPLHAVTAKHCIEGGVGIVGSKLGVGTMAAYTPLLPKGNIVEIRKVKSVYTKPAKIGTPEGVVNDWAFVEFDAPVKASPVRVDGWQTTLSAADLTKGNAWALGYGRNEKKEAGKLLDTQVKVGYAPTGGIWTVNALSPTGPCLGDSGGPLVVKQRDGTDVAAGIVSIVMPADCTKPHRTYWAPTRKVMEDIKNSWSPTALTQRLAKCALADRQSDKCPATHPWDSGGVAGPKAPAGPLAGKYCAQTAECAIDLFRLYLRSGASTTVARHTQ